MQICIRAGTLHTERSLMYLICNTLEIFPDGCVSRVKKKIEKRCGNEDQR
jgi:hypothetical protein